MFFEITNNNFESTELERTRLFWQTPATYPGMYLSSMELNSEVHWRGERSASPFDTQTFTGTDLDRWFAANRSVPGGGQTALWEAVYRAGPQLLNTVMSPASFGGSIFYLLNPETGQQCEIEVDTTPPNVDPDNPPEPEDPTPTFTPDCVSADVRIVFDRFDNFGVVVWQVYNDRNTVAPLWDFNISWPNPSTLSPPLQPGILQLRKITVGGRDAQDTVDGTLIWTGPDASPDTRAADGTYFREGYVFPPNSMTTMYLDFDGTSSDLSTAFGIGNWMFNGSWLNVGCGVTGPGAGGPGGPPPGGYTFISENQPPEPTNTPAPTNTPGPTFTPSPTVPSPTPSNTPTPGPSNTPIPTQPPPTNTPDLPPGVGPGGEGGN